MTRFSVGDTVMYGTEGVCRIEAIGERDFMGRASLYYTLRPVYAAGTIVFVPAENETLVAKMRRMLSADEIRALIAALPEAGIDWIEDDNARRARFGEILQDGDRAAVVGMLRALCHRREARQAIGRKLHAVDERILRDAEKLLYEEFSHVLQLGRDEILPLIMGRYQPEKKTENLPA